MVASQLRTNAVDDARVVAAMAAVARERFVPEDKVALAYADTMLALGGGRAMNLPMATGRLLTDAAPIAGDHVLVVGAGTGYAAALAARLGGNVVALEQDPALASRARAALADRANVEVVEGPLAEGWPAGAPYEVILIDGAGELLPDAIIAQLAEGGRFAGGVIEKGVARLVRGRKQGGAFGASVFAEIESARLPGLAKTVEFVF